MKKTLYLFAACLCALVAQAATYNYLVFTDNLGNRLAIPSANLTMVIANGELQATYTDGSSAPATFILADLASMQFSETETLTSLSDILDAAQPVQVFSITGTALGSFSSFVEAAKQLSPGAYVISNGNTSQTIVVK